MKAIKTNDYRRALHRIIKESNIFSSVKVFFGSRIDINKVNVNDLDKPMLAICFPGGQIEKETSSMGSNLGGYRDGNTIFFFIIGRNNVLDDEDDFSFNDLQLDEAKDMLMKTIQQQKDYWEYDNKNFNFGSYSYLDSEDFNARNISVLVLQANHKYKNL